MSHEVLDIIAKQSPHLDWIKDRTIFLTIHGSRAYNTNIEGSDTDWRGIAIPPPEYFHGFSKVFDQALLEKPYDDTTIFGIKKFFNLASNCNPNCIEILYTDPSDHQIVSPLGEKLLENRDLFLSKRIKHTTMGYAWGQMSKLKLHRQWFLHPLKSPPTRKEMGLPEELLIPKAQYEAVSADVARYLEKFNFDFLDGIDEPHKIAIRNSWQEMLTDLNVTRGDQWVAAARAVGLNDNFIDIMQKERAYRNAVDSYSKYQNWKKTRNPERYKLEEKHGYDTKFALHLVRITRECREVLTTGKLNVKRPDREELLAIRNGAWSFEQLDEFFTREEVEMKKLYQECTILPHHPDVAKLDELCISLIESSFK